VILSLFLLQHQIWQLFRLTNFLVGIFLVTLSRKLLIYVCFLLVILSKTGDIFYKAQSQDEDALVQAAAQLHMIYFNKSGNILGTVLAFTFESITD